MTAVAVRVLRQILLVVVLGVVEPAVAGLRERCDLGGYRPQTRRVDDSGEPFRTLPCEFASSSDTV